MTRKVQAADMQTALRALDVMLGSAGDPATFCPIWHSRETDPTHEVTWHRPLGYERSGDRLVRFVRLCDEQFSDQMEIGLAMKAREMPYGPMRIPFLWARIEGPKPLARARSFRPLPTMVVCEGNGAQRLLLWWVAPLDYFDVQAFNRKLAYRFGAVQKHGTPENLRIPLPGTCLREGRSRPVPVVVSRLQPTLHDGPALVERLKDPPELDMERFRKASGK